MEFKDNVDNNLASSSIFSSNKVQLINVRNENWFATRIFMSVISVKEVEETW